MTKSQNMNTPIKWYSINKNLSVVEHDVVQKEEAYRIVDEYFSKLKNFYETGEDAIAETMFGFQKSKSEFIEICIHGDTHISFKYEVKKPVKILFFNVPKVIQAERRLHSKEELKTMVSSFYDLGSDEYLSHARR